MRKKSPGPEEAVADARKKLQATVSLKLSEYDRGCAKLAFSGVPWDGGEDGMMARLALQRAIRVDDLDKYGPDCPIDRLSKKAEAVRLKGHQVELLVSLLAGGGQAWKPDVGLLMAAAVERVRAQCPKVGQ